MSVSIRHKYWYKIGVNFFCHFGSANEARARATRAAALAAAAGAAEASVVLAALRDSELKPLSAMVLVR